jgi:hypothetical protein
VDFRPARAGKPPPRTRVSPPCGHVGRVISRRFLHRLEMSQVHGTASSFASVPGFGDRYGVVVNRLELDFSRLLGATRPGARSRRGTGRPRVRGVRGGVTSPARVAPSRAPGMKCRSGGVRADAETWGKGRRVPPEGPAAGTPARRGPAKASDFPSAGARAGWSTSIGSHAPQRRQRACRCLGGLGRCAPPTNAHPRWMRWTSARHLS